MVFFKFNFYCEILNLCTNFLTMLYFLYDYLTNLIYLCFSILEGLVDGHTHPVWVGDRVHEFAMKVGISCFLQLQRPDLCIKTLLC